MYIDKYINNNYKDYNVMKIFEHSAELSRGRVGVNLTDEFILSIFHNKLTHKDVCTAIQEYCRNDTPAWGVYMRLVVHAHDYYISLHKDKKRYYKNCDCHHTFEFNSELVIKRGDNLGNNYDYILELKTKLW